MYYFSLANEGELFACDLKFRLCHSLNQDEKNVYTGDPGSKNEDAISNLNNMKRQHLEKFQAELKEIFAANPKHKNEIAVAIYLATYFDSNQSCI